MTNVHGIGPDPTSGEIDVDALREARIRQKAAAEAAENPTENVPMAEAEKDLEQGVALQHNEEESVETDPENQQVRAAANQQNVDEVAAMKEQAAAQSQQAAEEVVQEQVEEVVAEPEAVVEEEAEEIDEDIDVDALREAKLREKAGLPPVAEEQPEEQTPPVVQETVEEVIQRDLQETVRQNEQIRAQQEQQAQQAQQNPSQSSQQPVQQQSLEQANKEIAEYKRQQMELADQEVAAAKQKMKEQAQQEIAAVKEQSMSQISQMIQEAVQQQVQKQLQQAQQQKEQEVVQDTPEETVVKGRPMPEEGYERLIRMNSKELKKIIKTSKDPKEVENAKIQLEATKYDKKIWTPTELSDYEREVVENAVEVSGKDKPFYKNRKAQRALRKNLRGTNEQIVEALDKEIEEAKTPEDKKALKAFRDAFASNNLSKKDAKILVDEMKIKDRVEHTVMVESNKDKKKVKEDLGDEAGDYRVKRHSKKFLKDSNEIRTRMSQAEAAGKPISAHQASHEVLHTRIQDGKKAQISGDGTFEESEVKGTATYNATTYKAARRELVRMGYKVDDHKAAKIVAPIVTGLAAAGAACALPIIVKVTATALATATAGGVTATASTSAGVTAAVHPWKQAAIGGATAAVIAALFGFDEGEENDILRNVDRCDLFENVDDGKGNVQRQFELYSYDDNDKRSESVKQVLRAIDELDLTPAQKVSLLREAAGEKGLEKLSMKELVLAYIHGMDAVKGVEEEIKEDENCNCNNDDNEEVQKPEETPKTDPKPTPKDDTTYNITEKTIGIPHKSGVYNGWSLATKAYVTLDGAQLTQKQIKELIDKIYGHNAVRQNGKYVIPKVWDLEMEIELSDGTKVKLRSREEILAMTAPKQENDSRVTMGAPRGQKEAEGVVKKNGEQVGDTIKGPSKEAVREEILKKYPDAKEEQQK